MRMRMWMWIYLYHPTLFRAESESIYIFFFFLHRKETCLLVMSFRLPYGMTDTSNRDDWMYKSNTTHTHTFGTVGRLTWPIFLFCHSTHKTFKCPFICVCMCMWRQCVWSAAIWINYIGNTNDTNISTIRTMQSIHYQIDVSRQCLEKCYLPKKKNKK